MRALSQHEADKHIASREEDEHISDEQPDFLPMFPWYSGTSADMYRTIFGLVVSLKLFLGRFDMRTMQVVALIIHS